MNPTSRSFRILEEEEKQKPSNRLSKSNHSTLQTGKSSLKGLLYSDRGRKFSLRRNNIGKL